MLRRRTSFFFCIAAFLLGYCNRLAAQYDPLFSQYRSLASYYNPAFVGEGEELLLTSVYHQQWIGVKGAPVNISLLANAPLKLGGQKVGLGISFLSQQKGLYTNTEAQAQVATGFNLWGGKFRIGLQGGLYNSRFDGTKVDIPDDDGLSPNDPAIPLTVVNGKAFDLSAGIYWTHPRAYVALATKHLTAPRIALNQNYYLRLPFSLNLITGYNIIRSHSLLSWHPSIFAITDFNSYRVDVNVDIKYGEKFEAGLMFRPLSATGIRLGMNLGKAHIGYAFEFPINELARNNWGSHELVVSYSLPMTPSKARDAMYKSIRLL